MQPSSKSLTLPPILTNATRIAAGAVCVFIVWACFAPVDEVVKGNGRTITSGQNKMIQHLEGGIVADILVQEGDTIDNEQPLFRIQNATNSATLKENQIRALSLEAGILRLNAEIDDKPLEFPETLRQAAPDIVQGEQRQFESRTQQRTESLRILRAQIDQKNRQLEEQTSKVTNLQRELATAQEQYDIVAGLEKAGAASTNRKLDARARVDRLKTELSTTTKTVPITASEVNEAKGRLEESKARQKNDLLEELRKATLESQQLAERLKADTDKMARTEVLSPVKGVVNRLYIHTIGGTVRPGELLAEITPFDENIIVEAKVAPEHRAKIWIGQPVKVKITAYEYAKYGTIPGAITDISADSIMDDQSKTPFYRVRVTLDASGVSDDKKIMPGMMTEVNILAGKRTVMDYLLRPLRTAKDDAFTQ